MELTKAQTAITLDRHRFRVLCCGRRFGKTTLAIEEMKACAVLRESRIAYIAPTYQQARDIAWNQLKKDCKDAALSINEARLEIVLKNVKGTESVIYLRGWEAVETLRGQRFDLLVIDEVAVMRDFWMNWQEVLRPTLTDTKGEALFISTPRGFNHFYELFNLESGIGWERPDPDFKSFHFTTYDNPHIPPEEVDVARIQLGEVRFEQEYLANFKKTEGLVYKEFDRALHVYSQTTEAYEETLVGVDFGFTNPCAVLTVKRDRAGGLWVESEYYEKGKTDAQVAEYVASIGGNRVFPDPAAAGAIEELRRHKVNVRDVTKGKDSIENGIQAVRDFFKAGKLHIHNSCKNLLMELETYSYPDKKPDHNESEKPIDENNHALDALRYIIMTMGKSASGVSYHNPGLGPARRVTSQLARSSPVYYKNLTKKPRDILPRGN